MGNSISKTPTTNLRVIVPASRISDAASPPAQKKHLICDVPMPTTFAKDAVSSGFFRRFVTDNYRSFLVALILPPVLNQFGPALLRRQYDLAHTYTVMLYIMIFMIPVLMWSTWSLSNWGESLTFADDLRIQKKDGTTVVINRPDVQQIRVSPGKMIIIVWRDAGRKRFCTIGKNRFSNATWSQLESFAQTWLPKP